MIEMLAVIAIVLLLTVLIWKPRFTSAAQRQRATCADQLQKIHLALELYAQDSRGGFPTNTAARVPEDALRLLVPQYCSDIGLFLCPGQPPRHAPSATDVFHSDYAYYMGRRAGDVTDAILTDAQVNDAAKGAGQMLFSADGKAPGNNHSDGGGNVLFVDGHVEASPPRAAFPLPLQPGVVLLNPKPQP